MENEILDSLNDLGYEGPLSDEVAFAKALDGGAKSLEYTKLVHILAEEIKKLCNLEETVNIMNDPDESSSFLLELSSFLKELGCPYRKLVTGHMSSRLQSRDDKILLLDYLVSELMAARMVNVDCPKEKPAGMDIVVQESPTAKDLKEILIALKFNKPPPNITPEVLFSKLEAKLKETIQKEGDKLVGKPLYNKALTEKDWKQLENTFTEMFEEYRLRRETLLTRLECTIQSFEWSDRLKGKKDLIQSTYRPKREHLRIKPDVKLSDFLAARTSLLHIEKTSSASVRKNTQSEVNKVLIGRVPDRGGRPNEQQPPPPEMPSWQQRSAPQGGGRGGGGRGGERGGWSGDRGGRGGERGGRGGYGGDRGGHSSERGGYSGERGGYGGDRGGRGGRGGDRGGRGGRVQGGYNQGSGDQRPQSSPAFNQNRNYQTYEVPPGGYNQNQNQGYGNQGYGYNQSQNQGYDSMGSYNQGYQGGGGGYKTYQPNPGYQTQNDRRGRGNYSGRR
ncbi:protein FAM98B [Colias croceus]|uniref:protein FAM98B n=1 Tax=Colias crocea TaxID=72248 RepID=UPI001E27A873|nr:protein FAM98B [Colias croceus]